MLLLGAFWAATVYANEASPRTAEVVVGLTGDVAVGWGDPGGLS
jgi:hypothetical protein